MKKSSLRLKRIKKSQTKKLINKKNIDTRRIKRLKNKTKKIRGGHIERNSIFEKILSIGYELETQSLTKLTLIEGDNKQILLNTTSNAKDYEIMQRIKLGDYSEDEYNKYEDRLDVNELMEIDSYTSESINNKLFIQNKDTTFLVANDVAVTPFTKYLNAFCNFNQDNEEAEDLINKNNLYTFETDAGEKYNINFESWGKQDCGTFADVEWIMTYYKPVLDENVILTTFINVIKNLIVHLEQLEKTSGRLVINFSEDDIEIVKKPESRILYHLPDSNLYYLQTHLLDESLDIDDICIVPQMTFSCKVEDIVDIFKELLKDESQYNEFKTHVTMANDRVSIVQNIENCINILFEKYNNEPTNEYKIIENSNNSVLIKTIKNCIFMILFKLQRYFNNYLTDEKVKNKSKTAKYLKDTLFFNSRHTNYELYKLLKTSLSEYFSNKLDDNTIVSIIQKLIIQQSVLEDYLIYDIGNVRKNAFSISNNLDENNKNYGDPKYSLKSYFNFFEHPIDDPDNRDDKNEIFNDWLQYNGIDIYSSTSDIKNNIVLVEVRLFARILSNYMYNLSDDKLKNSMTNGICNRLKKYFHPDITGFSLKTLKNFIELYEKM